MSALKGEASYRFGDRTYTLRFDFNALCEIEDADGRPIAEVFAELSGGKTKLKTIRAVVFGGLKSAQPDATPELAGQMLLEDGAGVMEAMRRALAGAMPAGKAASPRPRQARPSRASKSS